MTTAGSIQRPQINSFYTLVTYPEQNIVEGIETAQQANQHSSNVDSAAPEDHTTNYQSQAEQGPHRVSAGNRWTNTATIIRMDSFSRTRNDDDEDILMGEDSAEDAVGD